MKPLAALVVLIAVVGTWWISRPGDEAPVGTVTKEPAAPETNASDVEVVEAPGEVVEPRAEPVERVALDDARTADPAPTAERSVVRGRVLHEGRPLSGLGLHLWAYRPWSAAGESAVLATDGGERHGFETETDSDGRFELDVPVPDVDECTLASHGTPFVQVLKVRFGEGKIFDHPRLLPGVVDLGDITLDRGGSVAGYVRRADGGSLDGVAVATELSFALGSRRALVDADGRYLLEGLQPGIVKLSAFGVGFLEVPEQAIEVVAGAVVDGPTFDLQVASTLSGVVVNADGDGIPRLGIHAWAESGGRAGFTRSNADGTFEVSLPQPGRFHLDVGGGSEYLDWSRRAGVGEECVFDPGTSDIRVVLERRPGARIRVIDAVTREVVPRPRVMTSSDYCRKGNRRHIVDGQDGVVHWPATPGRQVLVVLADGYGPYTLDAEWTDELVQVREVELLRAGTIVGRVVQGEVGVRGVRVALHAEPLPTVAGEPIRHDDLFGESWTVDTGSAGDCGQETETGDDGTFAFTGVVPGTHCLQVGPEGDPFTLFHSARDGFFGPIEVAAGQTVELDPIDHGPTGDLEIEVLMWEGASANRLMYRIDHGGSEFLSSNDGKVTVEGLTAGQHVVTFPADHRRLIVPVVRVVDVVAGSTTALRIDLRDEEPVELDVRVVADGAPLVGAELQIDFMPADVVDGSNSRRRLSPESTGAEGRLLVRVPVKVRVSFKVGLERKTWPWTEPVTLPAGRPVHVEIDVTDRFNPKATIR